jgi:type I restriction enzyme M protein
MKVLTFLVMNKENQEAKKIPRWIKDRYLYLLGKFKEREFDFDQAQKVLEEKYQYSEAQTKRVVFELQKAGYLNSKGSPKDRRVKIYNLVNILKGQTGGGNKVDTRAQLHSILKNAADLIRTRVDYTFILLLLFYKAISDRWQVEYNKKYQSFLKDGWKETEAIREAVSSYYHTFNLPSELSWESLRKNTLKLAENLSRAMKKLGELNPDYKDIFTQFDFLQFTQNQENNEILIQLFELFSKYSFSEIESDVLGDAYEWILKYFAPSKAKEGEVYTSREVIRLMVEILKPEPKKSVYDCSLGSGGMLIVSYQYVKEHYSLKEANTLFLYGQEYNHKTLALAKMNMLLHNIKNHDLRQGDTLLFPKITTGNTIKKFNYTIANPPWNQKSYGEENLKKAEYNWRFNLGYPSKQSADWAWIQHMLASIKDDDGGKMTVIIDTGAASRAGREKAIRAKTVEADLVEAIILLPEKLFYNTGAPGLVIVFNKNKPKERKEKILLINASKEFTPGKPQNTLSKENIRKIVEVYDKFKEAEGLSKVIKIEEIKKADFNLSPSRFVSAIDAEVHRPIKEITKDLQETESERKKIEADLEKILKKISFK